MSQKITKTEAEWRKHVMSKIVMMKYRRPNE